MRRVETGNSDELAYAADRGCGFAFGVPFMLAGFAGVAFGVLALLSYPTQGAAALAGGALAGGVGLVFTVIGGLFAFVHSGITFNRRTRTIRKWWRIFGIHKEETHPFDSYEKLRYWRDVTRDSDGDTQVSFPVKLRPRSGEDLSVCSFSKEDDAHAMAEQIGKFCSFSVENAVGAEPVLRLPGELDENLRQRAARKGVPPLSAPPAYLRAKVQVQGNRVQVEIPAPPLSLITFLPVGAAAMFALMVCAFILLPAFSAGGAGLFVPVLILAFLVVLPISLALWSVKKQRGRACSISADKQCLTVEPAGLPAEEIPADELEELRLEQNIDPGAEWLGTHLSIVARSDKKTLRFGQGLSKDELGWLCVLLERAIVAELQPAE